MSGVEHTLYGYAPVHAIAATGASVRSCRHSIAHSWSQSAFYRVVKARVPHLHHDEAGLLPDVGRISR